jgi:hypothetical protein
VLPETDTLTLESRKNRPFQAGILAFDRSHDATPHGLGELVGHELIIAENQGESLDKKVLLCYPQLK